METKSTYLDFFNEFHGKLSYGDITQSISSIRWRLYRFITLLILVISSFMVLFAMFYPALGWWALVITAIFCFLLLRFIYAALNWLNKRDLKDMVKVYAKLFKLSPKELTDLTSLVNRVRDEKLKEYFKGDIHYTDYIISLKEDAKESADETKKELKITSLGIVTVALVILSAYLSAVFNLWKNDSFAELSLKTLIIALLAGTFCWVIYILKEFHLFFANRIHDHHMELYKILKNLERRSKFK